MRGIREVKRAELLAKSRKESPKRYARRMNYINRIKPKRVDVKTFLRTGSLISEIGVGDWVVIIRINGIMALIAEELRKSNRDYPDRPLIYKVLRRAVDESDIRVKCTCPDFKYRFAYWATRKKYYFGRREIRPSKITNPRNDIGAVCKHATAVLIRPSQWIKYNDTWIATTVKRYMKANNISFKDKEAVANTIESIENADASGNVETEAELSPIPTV